MDYAAESLKKHKEWKGKIEVICRAPLNTRDDLSLAYTPGVAPVSYTHLNSDTVLFKHSDIYLTLSSQL